MQELFADSEKIRTYINDYNDEYEDITIKETYDMNPYIEYPCIDISEISNTVLKRYKDETGNFARAITYQFNISCDQSKDYTALENIRRIAFIIDSYFQEDRYHCLDNVGGLAIAPNIEDPNIKTGYVRYDCVLVSTQNTIYRRY